MRKRAAFCLLLLISLGRLWSFGKKDSPTQVKEVSKEEVEVFKGQNDFPDYPDYFNDVLNTALEEIYKKSYIKAVKNFVQKDKDIYVLDYGKTDFVTANADLEESAKAEACIEKIISLEKQYEEIWQGLYKETQGFSTLIEAASYDDAIGKCENINQKFQELSLIQEEVSTQGKSIQSIFLKLKSKGIAEEKSWLSYCEKFILGTGKTAGTGLIGAMETASSSIYELLCASLEKKALSDGKIIESGLTEKEILKRESDGSLPQRVKYRSAAEDLYNLSRVMEELAKIDINAKAKKDSKKRHHEEDLKKSAETLKFLGEKTQELFSLADSLNESQAIAAEFEGRKENVLEELRSKKDSVTKGLSSSSKNFSLHIDEALALSKEKWIKSANDLPLDVPRWQEEIKIFTAALSFMGDFSSKRSTDLLTLASERLIKAGDAMYADNSSSYNEAKKNAPYLLEENAERTDLKQHPKIFLESTEEIRKRISDDIAALENGGNELNEAGTKFKGNIQVMQKKLKTPIDKLKELDKTCKADSDAILTQQLEAKAAINEVSLYYSRALQAYNSENYNSAQTNLNKATKTYDSILYELRKDADIQDETFSNLTQLKQDLVAKQRPLLIRKLRDLKANIKSFYYAGDFEEANACIIQADQVREEWALFMDSQMESDDELERLRTLVNTALSIKSGRVLNPEDPLYPEMSQILSISYQYYTEGQKKLSKKETKEGKKLLTKAKDKLNELKVVYPRNKEASLLSMRIDKILDPKSFTSMFREKFNELKKINYASRDANAVAGYGDLQDLYEMDSSYPGLSDFIYEVEISLGLRERPVDNSAKEAAEAIAQEALAELDNAGRDTLILEGIKAKAKEALELDENNGTALAVIDEIALRTGAQAAVVLSAEDEAKYQQAVSYLQNGNIIAANANLQQLLQKSENARSAKILKLKNRIEGMLK